MQLLVPGLHSMPIEPENKQDNIQSFKEEEELTNLNSLQLDFSIIQVHPKDNIHSLLRDILRYCQNVHKVGFILKDISFDFKIVDLAKELKQIEYLEIDCIDNQSLGFALLILERFSQSKIKHLTFNVSNIQMEQPFNHVKIIKTLQSMDCLEELVLQFNQNETTPQTRPHKQFYNVKSLQLRGGKQIYEYYLPLFPDIQNVQLQPDHIVCQIQSITISHLTQLQVLTIQSINFIKLKELVNLRELTITEKFGNFIYFEDFPYLHHLQKLVICPQLQLVETSNLNDIKSLPKNCIVEIKTLYYNQLQQFGQIPGINLKISQSYLCTTKDGSITQSYPNWGGIREIQNLISFEKNICHGEQFSNHQILNFFLNLSQCTNLVQINIQFFSQKLRKPCFLTKEIEREFIQNTDILFLHTDLKYSQSFQQLLLKKQSIYFQLITYNKIILPFTQNINYKDLLSDLMN